VSDSVLGQGGTGVPPVTTRQHRRDACAPWKSQDRSHVDFILYSIVPAKSSLRRRILEEECIVCAQIFEHDGSYHMFASSAYGKELFRSTNPKTGPWESIPFRWPAPGLWSRW